MKSAIQTLEKRKTEVDNELAKETDDARAQQLTLEAADIKLALAILQPIQTSTESELNRWRNGYASIRNNCIEKGFDLS